MSNTDGSVDEELATQLSRLELRCLEYMWNPDVKAVSVIQGCPQRYGRQKQKYAQKHADQLAWHTVETRSAVRPKHSLTLECNHLPFTMHLEHNSLHKILVEHLNEDNSEYIAQTPLRSNICKVLIFFYYFGKHVWTFLEDIYHTKN